MFARSRWFWRASREYVGSAYPWEWARAYVRFMWFSYRDNKEMYR